jgi:hypothetical protein
MELRIWVNLDNDAFQDDEDFGELPDILETLASILRHEGRVFDNTPLYDRNGNGVGQAYIEGE